jgi:aminoglycoside phosphotransferase (APT) family kinase protein
VPGPPPLPVGPEELTPAWLTGVLRGGGVVRQATVVSASWERIGEDRGFTGVLARVHLRYEGAGAGEDAPPSLVAKFPLASREAPSAYRDAQERDAAARRQHYERCAREVRFYREVAPLVPVPAPRAYYAAADEATGRVVLLLEDLRAARPGDVLEGCSAAESALVVEAIAPFHARAWAGSDLDALAWPPRWGGDPRARQERYNRQVGPFLRRFGPQVPAPVRDLLDGLRSGYAPVLAALAQAPATLIHADLHLDNLLFNPPSRVPPVVVLDWQGIARGAGAVDLALFLFGSLAVEERRAAERALLERYHARLVEHGVMGYTLDQLRDHCRLALLWHLAGVVGWLASADIDRLTGRERALVRAAVEDGRLFAALVDHDVAALLAGLSG